MSVHDATPGAWTSGPGGDWRAWLQRHPLLSFLLLLPLVVAAGMAVLRIGIAAVMPLPVALLFYGAVTLPVWLATHALSSLAHRLLAPWRPPLWVPCVVGSISQALLLSPFYRAMFEWAQPFLLEGTRLSDKPTPAWTLHYVSVLLSELAPGALIWIAANYLWDRYLGIPRFRHDDAAMAKPVVSSGREAAAVTPAYDADAHAAAAAKTLAAQPDTAPEPSTATAPTITDAPPAQRRPAFLSRSRLPTDSVILAITAEEHYIRVHSDRGTDLVRGRFSEALAELAGEARGMQVHRSWWLRLDAVAKVTEKGRSIELVTHDGTVVPVSLAFREATLRALRDDAG